MAKLRPDQRMLDMWAGSIIWQGAVGPAVGFQLKIGVAWSQGNCPIAGFCSANSARDPRAVGIHEEDGVVLASKVSSVVQSVN